MKIPSHASSLAFLLRAITLLAVLTSGAKIHAADITLTTLKQLHFDTDLVVDGAVQIRIAAPASLREDARRVQAALTQACGGATFEVVDPASVAPVDYLNTNLVLLGNLMNNPIVAKLYARHFCYTDSHYPGKGGWEVRTIHNPMGCGHNFVLLGGSDDAGVTAAAQKFTELLSAPSTVTVAEAGKTVQLRRLLAAHSSLDPKQKTTAAFVASRSATICQNLDNGNVRGQMGGIVDAGMSYYLTGDEGWARIFRAALLHYYELAQSTGDWALIELSNDPTGQYFWPWKVFLMWDNVEESPVFSADDRLKIENFLLNMTRWVAKCDIFDVNTRRGAPYRVPDLPQNHPTYLSMSMFFGAEYYRMYYPAITEFAPRYADIARIFDGQALSYHSNDNATVYSPLAPQQYLCYTMTRGDLTPQLGRNLQAMADSVIIATDNRSDVCTFGDTPSYTVGNPRGLPFLSKAAWYLNDAGARWAVNWIASRSRSGGRDESLDGLYGDQWYQGLYYTSGPAAPPARLLGVAPSLLDEGIYRFMQKKLGDAAKNSPPREQCFDKLSLRRNFSPQDEYLMMSGISGVLVHGHDDGNAILRLTWRDRIWIANLGYRDGAPAEHSGLVVRHDGALLSERDLVLPDPEADADDAGFVVPPPTMPAFTALQVRADLPATAFTRTSVANYSGVDWHRNILWQKGGYFLVFDDVQAREKGSYQLRLGWRFLGQTTLSGNDLAITQDGETFNLKNADASKKNVSVRRPDRNSEWSRYEHADGTVRILSEITNLPAKENVGYVYANVMFPGASNGLAIERIGERTVRLVSGSKTVALAGLADKGNEVGDFSVQAAAFQISRDTIAVFDGRRLSVGGLEWNADAPLSAQIEWAAGTGTIVAAHDTELSVKGHTLSLDGVAASGNERNGVTRVKISAGSHTFRMDGATLASLDFIVDATYTAQSVTPPSATSAPALPRLAEYHARAPLQTLAIGDLDHDGAPEIVVAAGNTLRALSASGAEKWTWRAAGRVLTLKLGDIAHDGKLAIACTAGNILYLLDGQGKELWHYEAKYLKADLNALTFGDLDRDGRLEILIGNDNSTVFAVDAAGKPLWRSYKDIGRAGVTALLVGDFIDADHTGIFVGTSRDHGAVMLPAGGTKSRWTIPGTHHVAAQIDVQGKPVILIGGPERRGPARLVDPRTGKTQKMVLVADDVMQIVPADLDGNGQEDFVTAFRSSGVYVIDTSGRVKRRLNFDSFPAALTVADFAGKGKPELAVGAQDGKIWVTDAEGKPQASSDLRSPIMALGVMREGNLSHLVAGAENGAVVIFQ